MINISHCNNDLLVLISAKTENEMNDLIDDTRRRYSEYCLAAKDLPCQTIDGRWIVVMCPTVELF